MTEAHPDMSTAAPSATTTNQNSTGIVAAVAAAAAANDEDPPHQQAMMMTIFPPAAAPAPNSSSGWNNFGQQGEQQQQVQQQPQPQPQQHGEQHQQHYPDPAAYHPAAAAGPVSTTRPPPTTTTETTTGTTELLMLETAANAAIAAAHLPAPLLHQTPDAAPDDAVALAAMQEAATIVMEAQQREQQQQQQQPSPAAAPFAQTYTYAAANAAYSQSLSISARSKNPLANSNSNSPLQQQQQPPITTTTAAAAATAAQTPSVAVLTTAITAYNKKTKRSCPGEGDPSDQPPLKKRPAPTRVPWEERLRQLKGYKEMHGDLLIPIRYKPSNLGKFVHNTREQYKLFHKRTPEGYKKKCSLTEARIQQLEELGFAWTTERIKRQNDDWQRRLKQLQEFKEKWGDCLVPHGYAEDPSFAEWIHRQRTSYHSFLKADEIGGTEAAAAAKAASPMMQKRFQLLKEMGFNFTVHSDKWMDHWNQLKDYKEKHGDCQVPTHYAKNPKLGRWVHTQRHQRRLQAKGKKSCMTGDRIAMLDELGFSWEVRPSLERPRATWHQRLDELQVYHGNYGHFQVDPEAFPQLHVWCQEQKQRLNLLEKNNGKDVSRRMNPERVQALAWIGFTKDTELLESGATPAAVTDSSPTVDSTEDPANTNFATTGETTANPMDVADTQAMEHVEDPTHFPASAHDIAVSDGQANPAPPADEERKEDDATKQDHFLAPPDNGQSPEDSFQNVVSI